MENASRKKFEKRAGTPNVDIAAMPAINVAASFAPAESIYGIAGMGDIHP